MSISIEAVFLGYIQHLDWRPGVTKHDQTHRAFLTAARFGLPRNRACELVVAQLQTSGAVLVKRDIFHQLNRAYAYIAGRRADMDWSTPGFAPYERSGFHGSGSLPPFSHPKLKVFAERVDLTVDPGWLKARSLVWPTTWWEYLAAVYQSEDKVAVFTDFRSREWQILWPQVGSTTSVPSSEDGAWYLCNPVDGQWHYHPRLRSEHNPQGLSCRSEESITSFRYMVLESDHTDENYPGVSQDWLKFLVQLPLRIVALCTSAGKSVHALVRLDAASKADWDRQVREMKPRLVEHGADQGALRTVQLTRLPYAYRGGRQQQLLFCNPAANGTPIYQLPVVSQGGPLV